ncbi:MULTISPECIES: hypothetical protein [Providencia]|uniref:hypothetical protein n=1 Tax=Providencia TaxID=586 RepID=UPI000D6F2791|nr:MULTISPECIES: hypothetical protein [Providencia]AWS52296.1 hypothetical protein AM461_16455 [Providencia rettgeri]MCG5290814.1 hypothetical protein [Providencia rettgeri]MCL0018967.1 hypothetical protein [Providencia rettgeri]MDM9284555.1 hypothetical protein [Providencia rettgeri]QZY65725.1 hypothetical protein K7H99_06730 [Providencia rettgeri]
MMSWKIPSLEHPPEPPLPRVGLWLFLVVLIGIAGFGIGVYLSSITVLSSEISNNQIIALFVVLPVIIILFIRLLIYSITAYRHQLFTNMLDDAHNEWRYWAGKHLGLLTHSRLTQIDEEKQEGVPLSSLPINKDNILTLNALKSLSLWEKQETAIQKLLTPIATFYHQHALTQPITLYWQAKESGANWTELIEQEAARLSLPLESVEILPYKSLSEWLLALYENAFEPKLYAILAFQLDSTASEEAASLLLAPQGFYESLRAPIKAKLLRPISTEEKSFADALKTQCEFQLPGHQLNSVWHSGITDKNKSQCIESYVQQDIHCLLNQFYDVDNFFGKGGVARHSTILSLVSDNPENQLIVSQEHDNLLLQQIIC